MEVRLFQQLSHPNIIQMLDAFIDENQLIIIFEWAPSGAGLEKGAAAVVAAVARGVSSSTPRHPSRAATGRAQLQHAAPPPPRRAAAPSLPPSNLASSAF